MGLILKLRNFWMDDVVNGVLDGFRGVTRFKIFLEKFLLRNFDAPGSERDISERDWDVLVIVDGCRFDTYDGVVGEDVEKDFTKASKTKIFMKENFSDGDWSDTVYVSANPFTSESEFKPLTG